MFKSNLAYEIIDESKNIVKLTKELIYDDITVPVGFHSDLDSIKRYPIIFWIFAKRAPSASVLHDYLYRKTDMLKENIDRIYYEALLLTEPKIIAWFMYKGVKYFSWIRSKRK